MHQRSRSLAAAEAAAPLLRIQPPPPSLLSVPPPAMAAGRVSPTPYFHHGHGNGVNPTLLSGDVKASAAALMLVLPRFFRFSALCFLIYFLAFVGYVASFYLLYFVIASFH